MGRWLERVVRRDATKTSNSPRLMRMEFIILVHWSWKEILIVVGPYWNEDKGVYGMFRRRNTIIASLCSIFQCTLSLSFGYILRLSDSTVFGTPYRSVRFSQLLPAGSISVSKCLGRAVWCPFPFQWLYNPLARCKAGVIQDLTKSHEIWQLQILAVKHDIYYMSMWQSCIGNAASRSLHTSCLAGQ